MWFQYWDHHVKGLIVNLYAHVMWLYLGYLKILHIRIVHITQLVWALDLDSCTYILKGKDECQHQSRDEHDHAEDKEHALVWCHIKLDGESTWSQTSVCLSTCVKTLTLISDKNRKVQDRRNNIFLTLVWKLKIVTRRQTATVMPRHITTDLVL